MGILLAFAFFSGLITIFAPCIWPILPVILSSSATGGKTKPLGITLGVITSFAFFTLTLSYIVKIIPFDPNALRLFAVIVIGFMGLALVIPSLNQMLEGAVSRISSVFGPKKNTKDGGFGSGLLTGFSLGIVWAPCAGPILATIAALSATRAVSADLVLVTAVYVIGVGIPLFLFATLGNRIFTRSRALSKYTGVIQRIFGVIMILTAVLIFTNADKTLQAKLLDYVPSYSNFLTAVENNSEVQKQLTSLKGNKDMKTQNLENKPLPAIQGGSLPDLGAAPEFTGITNWLNTESPLTLQSLRGKVVLVDFWTYTCINCIRTLPHVTGWYEKYKDKGFVIVGVHTPEFEFEKDTGNVEDAISRFAIRYPVAQDNDYATWNAYDNHYWPAEYLIDAKGRIRRTHFGEGKYDEMEEAIQSLLEEAGKEVDTVIDGAPDQTPRGLISPETYIGSNRMERLDSSVTPSLHHFSLNGTWDIQPEYSKAGKGSFLNFRFRAEHVYLVMRPEQKGDTVRIFLDDKPLAADISGKDVTNGAVTLDTERLYDLVDLKGKQEEHVIRLQFEEGGTQVFAFTFG